MQRRTTLAAACACMAVTAWLGSAPVHAQSAAASPRIAVTDLAYAERVSEYFAAGTYQRSSKLSAQASHSGFSGQQSMQASSQASGTFVAGQYSYIEQRELGGYTNDIKAALLQGTSFRLVQGKGFDAGAPQPSKAEQVLHQVQTGKMATPVRQPSVNDIIARIRKGEFNGADYVLFGTVSSIDFTDALSPLQGSTSATRQYGLQLLADFTLIHTKTYAVKAAFSAQGEGNDTKILSVRGDIAPPNRAKVMRETSLSLAQSVYQQLAQQLGLAEAALAHGVRPAPVMVPAGGTLPAAPAQPEQVLILR